MPKKTRITKLREEVAKATSLRDIFNLKIKVFKLKKETLKKNTKKKIHV